MFWHELSCTGLFGVLSSRLHGRIILNTFAECIKYLMSLLHLDIYCFIELPNLTTFRYTTFLHSEKISLEWNPLCAFIFRCQIYGCCNGQFPGEWYVIHQLQTCTALVLSAADCTEGSCSFNIGCNFWQVFNF